MINRRGILVGVGAMLAAPAIVHAGNLMPIKIPKGDIILQFHIGPYCGNRWIAAPGTELVTPTRVYWDIYGENDSPLTKTVSIRRDPITHELQIPKGVEMVSCFKSNPYLYPFIVERT